MRGREGRVDEVVPVTIDRFPAMAWGSTAVATEERSKGGRDDRDGERALAKSESICVYLVYV